MQLFWTFWEGIAVMPWFWRGMLKTGIFLIVVVEILFPNPILLVKQLYTYAHIETLIQPDFPGIERINQEIDARLPAEPSREQELQVIQQYVYQQIPYAYDWEIWWNSDFWPTAEQVWARKQEDCDGRAVLAASILRSRGFTSARLVGSIRHIWVMVDQDALMGPDREQTLIREGGKTRIVWPSRELLLGSVALHFADFPTVRNLMILLTLMVLCYHPCKNLTRFSGLVIMSLLGFILFKDWAQQVMVTHQAVTDNNFFLGGLLLCAAVGLSLTMETIVRRETVRREQLVDCASVSGSTP